MKSLKNAILLLLAAFLFQGCGIHTALMGNLTGNMTNVELSKKNFKVVEKISGTSDATYIMGIGGLSHKALIEKARADMLKGTDLTGSSKAIVNVTVEEHLASYLVFYVKRTVTVSAHIVEFTE